MTDKSSLRRAAANWYMQLQEEPENQALKARFKLWLAADPHHVQAWAAISQTIATLQQAPPERQHYVLPAAQAPQRAPAHIIKRRIWRLGAGVAGAIAACAVLALFAPDVQLWFKADYYTGYSQTQNVYLADGSSVRLAPRTALAVNITSTTRTITLLRGEALFTVHHNSQVPFVVMAPYTKATDLGTVFDVLIEQGSTIVAVKEGSSRVEPLQLLGHGNDLRAGNWVSVAGEKVVSGTQSPDRIGVWADGVLVARNLSVADLIERLRPWSHQRIILLNKALAKKHVTGVYDLSNPLKALQLAVRPHNGQVNTMLPGMLLVTADK